VFDWARKKGTGRDCEQEEPNGMNGRNREPTRYHNEFHDHMEIDRSRRSSLSHGVSVVIQKAEGRSFEYDSSLTGEDNIPGEERSCHNKGTTKKDNRGGSIVANVLIRLSLQGPTMTFSGRANLGKALAM
jgi:hypothetical protein